MENVSPATRAAATRRIRKRAADWRAQVRPPALDGNEETGAKVREHIEQASAVTFMRPPLATESILAMQRRHLESAMAGLARSRRASRTWERIQPGYIGGVRLARVGLAALTAALDGVHIGPKLTRCRAINAGDLVEVAGVLERVTGSTGDSITLESGDTLTGEEFAAIRPADAEEYREAIEQRAKAERDRLRDIYETATAQFATAFAHAWAARDFDALRAAVTACHAAFEPLGRHYGTAREAITHRAAIIREGKPPRYPKRGQCARGFASHIARERELQRRLTWCRNLPGWQPNDSREVVTVKDYAGRRIRVSGAALRGDRWGQHIPRVNAAGEVTRRTGSVHESSIVAIA